MLYFPTLVCWNGKFGSQLCGLFDSTQNRPCLGSCGHSVCTPCLDKNPNIKCPICGLENAFFERKINYTALNFIEMFSENCVEVYKNWWQENQETIGSGYCTHCATDCQSLRLCITCELSVAHPIIEFHEQEDVVTLKIDKVSVAKLPLSLKCANCIADNDHENHRVIKLKDVKNSSINIKNCSHEVANRFLKRGLENSKGRDCQIRYDRMMRTCKMLGQEISMICFKASAIVLFEAEREDLTEKYEKVNQYLESLKAQWMDFQKDPEETCECTELFQRTSDIEIVNHILRGLSYRDLDAFTPGCPLALEKNLPLWMSIPFALEVDGKGNLKILKELKTEEEILSWKRIIGKEMRRLCESSDRPATKPSNFTQEMSAKDSPKPSDHPATPPNSSKTKQESKEPKDPSGRPNAPYATLDQMKSLYDHLKKLTKVVESLVKLVPEDRIQEIPKIPEMPAEPVE